MRALELYYSIAELAMLLRLDAKTIRRRMAARDFGAGVVNLGSEERPDYRIPVSGVNAWLDGRRLFHEPQGVAARTVGELRRKAA